MLELACLRRVFFAFAFLAPVFPADAAQASVDRLGHFTAQGDVGAVSRPAVVTFDAVTKTYTIGASGKDIWGNEDAFGFVWKEVRGDFAMSADIALVGESKQGHRKGALMFRASPDADAPYVDVAVHGDGLISLQFRRERGGPTRTIQAPASAPQRVRLEKRGETVTLSLAGADGAFLPSGCAVRLSLGETFLAGLAVTAHDNAAFETATFANVEMGAPAPLTVPRLFALEVLAVASADRRVIFRGSSRMESPIFSPEGREVYFNRDGRIQRLPLTGGEPPVVVDTGPLTRCNNDHGISPDGTQLVVSDLTETGQSLMYLLPIGGGTPRRVEVGPPAYFHGWSPDGKTLAYCAARGGEYDIYTIPVAGGTETRLTTRKGNDNGPDYSPVGRWIYYHAIDGDSVQAWRMRPDGSGQEQVTHDDYYNWYPHPSPDGKWIALFSSKTVPDTGHPPDGEYVLRLLPTSGGEPREIARFYGGNGSINVPCWSRDSTHIAYAVFEPERK